MTPNDQPMPGAWPLILTPQYPYYQPAQPRQTSTVPPRVKLACEVLAFLSDKTASTPLPLKLAHDSEVSFEPMPGQELTHDERELLKATCQTIKAYVTGRLRPGVWDRPPESKKVYNKLRIPCPNCQNACHRDKAGCHVCGGRGTVLIARDDGVVAEESDD